VASKCLRFSIACSLLLSLTPLLSGQMLAEKLRGPATKGETDSFLSFISSAQPAASNENNAWSYGPSGQVIRAAGLVYQINHYTSVLDRMLVFCDSMLSERNDLAPAPVGQHMIWTGRIDPREAQCSSEGPSQSRRRTRRSRWAPWQLRSDRAPNPGFVAEDRT
jgi:hypothetical protein